MKDIWREIKGYDGKYKINKNGIIKSKNKILKPSKDNKGYLYVILYKNGYGKHKSIHRLVAETFIPNSNKLKEVNHIDGNSINNNISNLEWITHSNNIRHAVNVLNKIKKPIMQYDLKFNFVKEWDSIKQVEEKLKIDHSNISKCCKGKRKQCGGYIWKYKQKMMK